MTPGTPSSTRSSLAETGRKAPVGGEQGLARLAAPILTENLVRSSLIAVDQFMLYAFATWAAAAMSASSQLAFFLQLLYQMPAQGAGILVAKSLGAGRRDEADRYALAGMALVGIFAVFVSLLYLFGSGIALTLFSLDPEVRRGAVTFLSIYGGASVFMALNIAQSAVLRAQGRPRDVMLANISALACTIMGNYVALFAPFGLPVSGLAGVALSNVFGQVVAFLILSTLLARQGLRFRLKLIASLPRRIVRDILGIGVPTAGENISYNLSQVAISAIASGMGTAALAAYGLIITITRYLFLFGISMGSAAQIKVGWLVGAGREAEAEASMPRWLGTAAAVSFTLAVSLNLLKVPIVGLFTTDPTIRAMVQSVFLVSLVYEPGRCLNTIIVPSLKGSGDVRFPVFVGVAFMWSVSVLGAWTLGRVAGLGLIGLWIAMCADEWIRGLIMLRRWRGGRWKTAFERRSR